MEDNEREWISIVGMMQLNNHYVARTSCLKSHSKSLLVLARCRRLIRDPSFEEILFILPPPLSKSPWEGVGLRRYVELPWWWGARGWKETVIEEKNICLAKREGISCGVKLYRTKEMCDVDLMSDVTRLKFLWISPIFTHWMQLNHKEAMSSRLPTNTQAAVCSVRHDDHTRFESLGNP